MRSFKQKGFTLPEMLVAMIIASVMMITISQAMQPALAFMAKQETVARLADIKVALEFAYKQDTKSVEANADQVLALTTGTISQVLPNANGSCNTADTTFLPIGRNLSTSAAALAHDGSGNGFCVFITPRLSANILGVNYLYHSIAVVSPGYDGALDPATNLDGSGSLYLGGDDKGILVDGQKLGSVLVETTLAQVNKAATALSNYFTTRFQSNPSRDIGVDYFANVAKDGTASTLFDSTGTMPSTGGVPLPITVNGMHSVLGLSLGDVTDPWGAILMLDNSSDVVRHPQNSNSTMRSPGFTARISTSMPSGSAIERTVVGTY